MLFRDRDKSKSAGDDSAARDIRRKFLSYFAQFIRGLDVLEILYAKLSTSIGSFLRNWNLKSYTARTRACPRIKSRGRGDEKQEERNKRDL